MTLVAQIVKVEAPSGANSGDTVIVDVSVKNLGLAPGGYNYIAVTGVYDSTEFPFQVDYLYVAPQETVVFRGWFTMPGRSVQVKVYSFYWTGSEWAPDDEDSVNIDLISLTPDFSDFTIADYGKV